MWCVGYHAPLCLYKYNWLIDVLLATIKLIAIKIVEGEVEYNLYYCMYNYSKFVENVCDYLLMIISLYLVCWTLLCTCTTCMGQIFKILLLSAIIE